MHASAPEVCGLKEFNTAPSPERTHHTRGRCVKRIRFFSLSFR